MNVHLVPAWMDSVSMKWTATDVFAQVRPATETVVPVHTDCQAIRDAKLSACHCKIYFCTHHSLDAFYIIT